jgi:molybdopterin-guanine dinucleotide biosynthesis protein A
VSPATVAGAVLAGGASTRFGSDKTAARLGPLPLVERVAAALRTAEVSPLASIGGACRVPGLEAVPDRHPGEGPLGGLVTALLWSPAGATVVLAADLPLLDDLTVRALVDRWRHRPEAVAVARGGGRLQPTCACWPASVGPLVEASFGEGERSIARVLARLDIEPVDVPSRVVDDVDTPDDLARMAVLWDR